MRDTILIQGAKENNLKNVTVEIPRNKLTVITGISGSGKSSLAFDTLYAEGQRRLLESMSSWAKRFVSQLKKPHVDFVNGLSPVISIDQKTTSKNPRSTVGTMTDISDYLRMLYATIGKPCCPVCEQKTNIYSITQMAERILNLPEQTQVEVRIPVLKIYGEDYEYLLEQIRTNGYRTVRIDNKVFDIGEEVKLDEEKNHVIEVIIDTFSVEKGIDKQITTALEHGIKLGNGFFSFHILNKSCSKTAQDKFYKNFGCSKHKIISSKMHHAWFTFNDASGACSTCSGLGTYMTAYPPLVVPDPTRSLRQGAIVKEALNHDKNTWGGRLLESLSVKYGFSLDIPFSQLEKKHIDILFYGTKGKKFKIQIPKTATQGLHHKGKEISYLGVITNINRSYSWYLKHDQSNNWAEEHFRKIMVENKCEACKGTRLKKQRSLVTIHDKNIFELGELPLEELLDFIENIKVEEKHIEVYNTIQREITGRIKVLVDVGLNYLNLNRTSGTLSGGESQRIRLSSQIGSGLMGMLYVLDEPSIGLHPKDNTKMINTLFHLRDIGNTVVVVEHDEETIRSADHIVEIGPGAGIHGGEVIISGSLKTLLNTKKSETGQYLSGKKKILFSSKRRKGNNLSLSIKNARQNNLTGVNVDIPLGMLVCITGVSGSGKSSLIHDVLHQKLCHIKYDSRIIPGDHDDVLGHENINDIIHIDQSAIGRTSRSNPATYIGFYDNIRKIFANTPEAKKLKLKSSHFSFNVKGGRCEECSGEGKITTKLAFMPDVEVICPVCKGTKYREEVLQVTYQGKNIAEVLDLSIEEGISFFAKEKLIRHKLSVLNDLGLGYITIGHPAPILSGGEAQRVKLASELGKIKRGKHNLYILDEPTTGLHFADINNLIQSFHKLLDQGHSIIVIEHNIDVIKTADYIIDLGPEGGYSGGQIVATGTPEQVAKVPSSYTGQYLKKYLSR